MNCPVCNKRPEEIHRLGTQSRIENLWDDCDIYICSECGLYMRDLQLTEEELRVFYKDYTDNTLFDWEIVQDKHKDYLEQYFKKTDQILEVGCGNGSVVNWYRNKGYNVIGYELDLKYRMKEGFVYQDFMKDGIWKPTYDVIYSCQVIEHQKDPVGFVRKVLSNLKSGGKFIIECPNNSDVLLMFPEFQDFYDVNEHLFFFDQKTIKGVFNHLTNEVAFNYGVIMYQKYGILCFFNWLFRRKPSNPLPVIPILDKLYAWFLIKVLKKSDTIIVTGEKL